MKAAAPSAPAASPRSSSSRDRSILEAHLAERRRDAIGEAIAEGYRRIPPSTPDEWGDLEVMADLATREGLQRLDLEEREAGFDPW